ncbi:MAG: low molecular weight phosphatase family protein [Nanoarchaeota archaeon]|nr:low molecular weight phosphatase family protein [Nanoarchaeota archaeon]
MKVLFVCKYNRFRSKVAEGFFNKLNKNKNLTASSAGIFQGYPVTSIVKELAKEFEIKITSTPKTISEDMLKQFNYIIIVANDVPASLFDHDFCKNVIVWKIPDTNANDKETIRKIFIEIEKNVESLVKELK